MTSGVLLDYDEFESPIGRILFASNDEGICALDYAGYHSPRLDAAFTAASTAPSDAARRVAWAEVQRTLADEVPVAWLYHARGVNGMNRRVHGVTMDVRGELVTLTRWWTSP